VADSCWAPELPRSVCVEVAVCGPELTYRIAGLSRSGRVVRRLRRLEFRSSSGAKVPAGRSLGFTRERSWLENQPRPFSTSYPYSCSPAASRALSRSVKSSCRITNPRRKVKI
jgi:hypothetical protein